MFRLLTIAFRTIKTTDGYSFSNSQGNREWTSAFFHKVHRGTQILSVLLYVLS